MSTFWITCSVIDLVLIYIVFLNIQYEHNQEITFGDIIGGSILSAFFAVFGPFILTLLLILFVCSIWNHPIFTKKD